MRRIAVLVLKVLVGLFLLAAVLYSVPVIAGLVDDDMKVDFDRADPSLVTSYGNGLTARQKEDYYHLSQGSEILPWELLTAIDVASPNSSRPFAENLRRYGLMPDPARDDGLAVGLSLSANSFTLGLEFVGVTCAACHVGEFRRNGKAVRVDGATNMLNLQLFYSEAIDAVMALKNGTKLWHALKRLGRQDYERYGIAAPLVRPAILVYAAANAGLNWDKVKARLELIQVIDEAKKNRDPNHPTSGFGRLDAFDGTRNFLLTRLRTEDKDGKFEVNKANLVKLDAPVKFPPLWSRKTQAVTATDADPDQPGAFPPVWGFKDFDWVEWTIDTDSVMERNVTETLGAGATVVLDPAKTAALFDNSIPIANMHRLEWLSYYIDPPKWPAELFGAIKPDLAAAGQTIFRETLRGLSRIHRQGPDTERSHSSARLRPRAGRYRRHGGAADFLPGPRNRAAERSQEIVHGRAIGAAEGLRRRQARGRLRRQQLRCGGPGRRRRHQAQGIRRGRNDRGAAAQCRGSGPTQGDRLARHPARYQAALRPIRGAAAVRRLGGCSLSPQRFGSDALRPVEPAATAAEGVSPGPARIRPGEARLRRRCRLRGRGLLGRHVAGRLRQWRPYLRHRHE